MQRVRGELLDTLMDLVKMHSARLGNSNGATPQAGLRGCDTRSEAQRVGISLPENSVAVQLALPEQDGLCSFCWDWQVTELRRCDKVGLNDGTH